MVKNIHDVTRAASLAGDHVWATGAPFGDYKGVAWEDLFVTHQVDFHLDQTEALGSGSNCQYFKIDAQCLPR